MATTSHKTTRAPDGRALIKRVLEQTNSDVAKAEAAAKASGKPFKKQLSFAISYANYISAEVAKILEPDFPGIVGGETPSRAARGMKRVDVRYSTPEAGLGLALSFKSVHFGEKSDGDARFTHNLKRNDEELRVEATGHHLRQPYAVMGAVVFLPFESCRDDVSKSSSFAAWVEYLWPLKGRTAPDDAPDRFELVFIALYERDGSKLGFYEVGGKTPCPRTGPPKKLLSLAEFRARITKTYKHRNGRDFAFEGEDSD